MRRCGPEAIGTFVGGGLERAETRLADYDRSSGKFLRFLEGTSGMQPGDPVKAAQAIIAAVESESPLLRLILKRRALPFLSFPGSRSEENEKAAVEKLRAWLEGQKIVGLGAPIFACYDPPWPPHPAMAQ